MAQPANFDRRPSIFTLSRYSGRGQGEGLPREHAISKENAYSVNPHPNPVGGSRQFPSLLPEYRERGKRRIALVGWAVLAFLSANSFAAPTAIQFNRDIRPILSENCFACHGPDKNKRKGDLRLDQETGGAFVQHKASFPIVPGNLEKSELIQRITSSDPDKLM
ncbi:MAG TPA: c-type cytochrome domain-containing protein, partial [Tepidisphaeraceae bacterium]|nr:c-type cytochrome domain-containing protein [Tepidisphaeraceae bacterium]